eukprot:Rmarinus@m.5969
MLRSLSQTNRLLSATRSFSTLPSHPAYETLSLSEPKSNVIHVEMSRPKSLNSMTRDFWREMRECFERIEDDDSCRAVVITSQGKHFTAGLDLKDAAKDMFDLGHEDVGRAAFKTRRLIRAYQGAFTAIEACTKPVIVAVQRGCIGGGVDMVSACDVRICTEDAYFQIKEVDLALAADVGTLQRLPRIIGCDSLVRELAYTARKLSAQEALRVGLVSHVLPDADAAKGEALQMAEEMAARESKTLRAMKLSLNYSRDHSLTDSLNYASMLTATRS